MTLAFVQNGSITKYPIGYGEIRRKFPNTSFAMPLEDQDLSGFGVVKVHPKPQPHVDNKLERLEEGAPVLEQGIWIQHWNIIPLSDEEKQQLEDGQKSAVRADRNQRLADCDWTQFNDSPLSEESKLAWQVYRQELRDITLQQGFPHNVVWPTKPE